MGALRGDELTAGLLPVAADLIVAVHDLDQHAVAEAFASAERLAVDPIVAARHLAIVLAAMVAEDNTTHAALGWTLDPIRYGALRDAGTPSLEASRLCGRSRSGAA